MKKLSFFLAISLATIVMSAGCKDKKPLKELTGTKWKSEDVSIQMEGMPMAVSLYIEADFTTNKDVSFSLGSASLPVGIAPENKKGTYTYSYPDIKVTAEDINFEGKFSNKDQFSTSIKMGELGDKTIVFNKIK